MSHPEKEIDVSIPWRNRALDGDVVAVHLLERRFSRVLVNAIRTYFADREVEIEIREKKNEDEKGGMIYIEFTCIFSYSIFAIGRS